MVTVTRSPSRVGKTITVRVGTDRNRARPRSPAASEPCPEPEAEAEAEAEVRLFGLSVILKFSKALLFLFFAFSARLQIVE